ncbi:hypothetical protein, partial [Pseudomonas agarici]|uniref:hypothetical protein n=1 Tax=Pseudomonas agarici TaxID=46677 RepID=UPI001B7FEA00
MNNSPGSIIGSGDQSMTMTVPTHRPELCNSATLWLSSQPEGHWRLQMVMSQEAQLHLLIPAVLKEKLQWSAEVYLYHT